MIMGGLMRIAPAQAFQRRAIALADPDQRIVERQPRDLGAGLLTGGLAGRRTIPLAPSTSR
jgi:hypothetical protein